MCQIHVRQTYLDPDGRKGAGRRLRPLDEADRVLEVRFEVAPLGRGEALETEKVEMRDVGVALVAVADREGRAGDGARHAERAAATPDEGRLAAPQLAGDGDEVAGAELAREPACDLLRLLGRSAPNESPVGRTRQGCSDQPRLVDAPVLAVLSQQPPLQRLVLQREAGIGPQCVAESK